VRDLVLFLSLLGDSTVSRAWVVSGSLDRGAVRPVSGRTAPWSGRLEQLGQPDQVAGRGGQGEHPADPGGAAMPGLAQAAGGLDPTEGFLDPLADALADDVAGIARRPAIDRRAA
jgi:hypothetical protein